MSGCGWPVKHQSAKIEFHGKSTMGCTRSDNTVKRFVKMDTILWPDTFIFLFPLKVLLLFIENLVRDLRVSSEFPVILIHLNLIDKHWFSMNCCVIINVFNRFNSGIHAHIFFFNGAKSFTTMNFIRFKNRHCMFCPKITPLVIQLKRKYLVRSV